MKKNVASQVVGAQLISKTDGSAVTSGTTTVYVTGDGGTQAAGSVSSGACTHEGNGYWTYVPAQAETNYDQIAFTFVNTSACNVTVQIYTGFPQTGDNYARLGAPAGASVSADIATVAGYIDTEVAAIKAKTDQLTFTTANRVDSQVFGVQNNAITAAAIATDAIDSDAIAASAVTELQSGLSTLDAAGVRTAVGLASANLDTQLGTIAGYIDTEVASILSAVDTEVAAIKAKTDSLTFTVAGQVDANIQYVNDVQVTGNGQTGTEWGPA